MLFNNNKKKIVNSKNLFCTRTFNFSHSKVANDIQQFFREFLAFLEGAYDRQKNY